MTQRATDEAFRVQAEPTEILVDLEGVECRVWNAITNQGDQVFLFVHRVASRGDLAALVPVTPPQMRRTV